MKIIRQQILWVVNVTYLSPPPRQIIFSLHNINYRKLCFIEKYTNNSETKLKKFVEGQLVLDN